MEAGLAGRPLAEALSNTSSWPTRTSYSTTRRLESASNGPACRFAVPGPRRELHSWLRPTYSSMCQDEAVFGDGGSARRS